MDVAGSTNNDDDDDDDDEFAAATLADIDDAVDETVESVAVEPLKKGACAR